MIDLDALVIKACITTWGQPATYTPAGGAPIAIQGIFDREYQETSFDGAGMPVSSRMPVLGIRASDLGSVVPAQSDAVTVGGLNFLVTSTEPDSHGHVLLKLRAVRP